MIHAGEQDLREKRLSSRNVNSLSCEQTGNRATGALHPHPDPKDQRFIAYCSLPGDRTTSSVFPRGFQDKSAPLDIESWSIRGCFICGMSGGTAVPSVHPKSMGPDRSWKTEELCFSQGKGCPTVPRTSPLHPQRGCGALPKDFPIQHVPIRTDASSSTHQAKCWWGGLNPHRGFFQGLTTQNATKNHTF